MLKVNNINTQYESVQVLFDVSFNIEKGEVVSLLGANGAGKSSTLRTIIGIARSETGSIYFDNERIDKKEPNRIIELGIAIVPEGRRLFPKLTVLENLKMGALFVKSEGEFRRNLDKVYSLFPILNERKDQLAGTFSGGEQGMLTIGRAIISNPKIMLMDEPSLGLAPIIVAQVFESIKKINHEGTTILLVEQNASQALQIASRGYVLQKGKIIVGGKVEELMVSEIIKKAYLTI